MIDIELAKREIAYRAQFIGLRFDSDDIFHVNTSPENVLVALARHYTYEEPESDGVPIKVYHNLLWFEYSQATHAYKNNTDFTIVNIPAPALVMRTPFLTCWIKDGEKMEQNEPGVWEEMTNDILDSFALELSDTLELLNEHSNHCTS